MADGYSMGDFHSSTAALIGSLETKLNHVTRAGDPQSVQIARELQQLLSEIHGLIR